MKKANKVAYSAKKFEGLRNGDFIEFNNGVKTPGEPDETLAATKREIIMKKSEGIVLTIWAYGGWSIETKADVADDTRDIKNPENNIIKMFFMDILVVFLGIIIL